MIILERLLRNDPPTPTGRRALESPINDTFVGTLEFPRFCPTSLCGSSREPPATRIQARRVQVLKRPCNRQACRIFRALWTFVDQMSNICRLVFCAMANPPQDMSETAFPQSPVSGVRQTVQLQDIGWENTDTCLVSPSLVRPLSSDTRHFRLNVRASKQIEAKDMTLPSPNKFTTSL